MKFTYNGEALSEAALAALEALNTAHDAYVTRCLEEAYEASRVTYGTYIERQEGKPDKAMVYTRRGTHEEMTVEEYQERIRRTPLPAAYIEKTTGMGRASIGSRMRKLVDLNLVTVSPVHPRRWHAKTVNGYALTDEGRVCLSTYNDWRTEMAQQDASALNDELASKADDGIPTRDRNALRQILARRKSVLSAEIDQRAREVESMIRDRLVEEGKNTAAQFQRELTAINARIRELSSEVEALMAKAHAAGLTFNRRSDLSTIDGVFQVASLDTKVRQEMGRLKIEKGAAVNKLNSEFLALEEELLVGAVRSENAKDFLKRVPATDQLLPSVDEVRQLVSGS